MKLFLYNLEFINLYDSGLTLIRVASQPTLKEWLVGILIPTDVGLLIPTGKEKYFKVYT